MTQTNESPEFPGRFTLPLTNDLEAISKTKIAGALKRATQATQKKEYHKIRHASDLLNQIDSSKVRGRCPSCERLFDDMIRAIQVV